MTLAEHIDRVVAGETIADAMARLLKEQPQPQTEFDEFAAYLAELRSYWPRSRKKRRGAKWKRRREAMLPRGTVGA